MDKTTITFEAAPETAQFIKQLVHRAAQDESLTAVLREVWAKHEDAKLHARLTRSWESAQAGNVIGAEALREKLVKKYSAMIS